VNRPHSPNGNLDLSRLTSRERQIFGLFGRGFDKHHIAEELGIRVKTIESHRETIKQKLGFTHVRDLVKAAVAHALEEARRARK